MEPIQRRSFDSVPPRRPGMNTPGRPIQPGTVPQRPLTLAGTQSSAFRPPAQPGRPLGMDISPKPSQQPHPSPAFKPASSTPNPNTNHDFRPHVTTDRPLAPQPGAHPMGVGAGRPQPSQPNSAQQKPIHPSANHEPVHADSSVSSKAPKGPHPTGHAGLVGFIVFIIIGGLCFSPLLPGKIWHGAPGSSESFSTGDQAIGCVGDLTNTKTTSAYNSKLGFPLIYKYSTTDTMTATCDGKIQHATGGHTSQFNPLAVAANFAITLAIAVIVAKIWRRFRGTD